MKPPLAVALVLMAIAADAAYGDVTAFRTALRANIRETLPLLRLV